MQSKKIRDMTYIALFAVLMAICSWISIPVPPVPFTLQTFAVFLTCAVLGGKRATVAVLVYVLLGLVGIPVFSGFRSGPAALFGATGGYIFGFVFCALIYWLITARHGSARASALGMAAGLAVCYTFGTVWFVAVYTRNTGAIGYATAFLQCVAPFLIPDAVKLALAQLLSKRLKALIRI